MISYKLVIIRPIRRSNKISDKILTSEQQCFESFVNRSREWVDNHRIHKSPPQYKHTMWGCGEYFLCIRTVHYIQMSITCLLSAHTD